jgi:hypothetical protein
LPAFKANRENHNALNLDYIKKYVILQTVKKEVDGTILSDFMELLYLYEGKKNGFAKIKSWFLQTFPDYTAAGKLANNKKEKNKYEIAIDDVYTNVIVNDVAKTLLNTANLLNSSSNIASIIANATNEAANCHNAFNTVAEVLSNFSTANDEPHNAGNNGKVVPMNPPKSTVKENPYVIVDMDDEADSKDGTGIPLPQASGQ